VTQLKIVTETPAMGIPAQPGADGAAHRLWGGRFGAQTAAALDAVNKSIGVDFRLWPHDIKLSKAWAMALWSAGILTHDECQAIEAGLDAVATRLADGAQPIESDEDSTRWSIGCCTSRSATWRRSSTPAARETIRWQRARGCG
jgi:hypothetical protein